MHRIIGTALNDQRLRCSDPCTEVRDPCRATISTGMRGRDLSPMMRDGRLTIWMQLNARLPNSTPKSDGTLCRRETTATSPLRFAPNAVSECRLRRSQCTLTEWNLRPKRRTARHL